MFKFLMIMTSSFWIDIRLFSVLGDLSFLFFSEFFPLEFINNVFFRCYFGMAHYNLALNYRYQCVSDSGSMHQ